LEGLRMIMRHSIIKAGTKLTLLTGTMQNSEVSSINNIPFQTVGIKHRAIFCMLKLQYCNSHKSFEIMAVYRVRKIVPRSKPISQRYITYECILTKDCSLGSSTSTHYRLNQTQQNFKMSVPITKKTEYLYNEEELVNALGGEGGR
jgi:hypothetical protein